jgi:hypothetical protein
VLSEAVRANAAFFHAFADAGKELAELHTGYENAPEYPLTQVVNKAVPFSWRVTKMRLSPDKTAVIVNDALTLAGIPPETFDYRLGNRSALEWVIDQYQVSTDKRSGITSDPNRPDDPEYIARLVGRVVTVSVETVRIVANLPALDESEHGVPFARRSTTLTQNQRTFLMAIAEPTTTNPSPTGADQSTHTESPFHALAQRLRADSIRCTTAAGSGHPSSAMSAAD